MDCFSEKNAIQEQLSSYSTGVKGESVGWHGFEGGGNGAEIDTGKRWGETRPYRMGLSRIAGRMACRTHGMQDAWHTGRMLCGAHTMRPYIIVPKKSKKKQFNFGRLKYSLRLKISRWLKISRANCGWRGARVSVFKVPVIIIIEGRFL
jgi:hypothetical protein